MKKFDSPDEFIAWVDSQSAPLKLQIARAVDVLMDLGLDGYVAAHQVYAIVDLVKTHKASKSQKATKPFDPSVN